MKLKDVRLQYSRKMEQLRIVCGSGGPADPEVLIQFGKEGPYIAVFNPADHDPSSNKMTGWSRLAGGEE